MNLDFDCIVIGSGIAGMTAAIYLKRANKKILLIEKEYPGGTINKSSTVQNYPGFIDISGSELSSKVFEQVENLNIDYLNEEVLSIENKEDYKVINTSNKSFKCKGIIIATGRSPKRLRKENENKLIGNGISFCASCDGLLYKNKDVCVIGGGNSAIEEALYLSDFCNSVNIIHRSSEFTADSYLIDKVKLNDKINVINNSEVIKYNINDNLLDSVTVINKEQEESIVSCKGVFLYIGYGPNTDLFSDLVKINNKGYIIVDNNMKTSIDNIYACGDIIEKNVYQLVTATSEGAIAANSFIRNN